MRLSDVHFNPWAIGVPKPNIQCRHTGVAKRQEDAKRVIVFNHEFNVDLVSWQNKTPQASSSAYHNHCLHVYQYPQPNKLNITADVLRKRLGFVTTSLPISTKSSDFKCTAEEEITPETHELARGQVPTPKYLNNDLSS